MTEAKDILVSALRQYKHNDNSGFVGGYEYEETQTIVQAIVDSRDELLEALEACDEAMSYMSEYDIPICLPDKVKAAIAKAKGEV